jgi:hypothetical protein
MFADVFDKIDDLVWGPESFSVKSKQVRNDSFSRKHESPQILVRHGETTLRNVTEDRGFRF